MIDEMHMQTDTEWVHGSGEAPKIAKPLKTPPWALYSMPEKSKTYDMCLDAVSRDGTALDAVPKPFRDEKMCRAAFASSPDCFPAIPDELKTDDMAEKAARWSPLLWHAMPERFRTLRTAKAAKEAFRRQGRPLPYELKGILATENEEEPQSSMSQKN